MPLTEVLPEHAVIASRLYADSRRSDNGFAERMLATCRIE